MKKIAKLSFAFAAILSLALPGAAQAQQSYKLVCRGPLANAKSDGPNVNSWYWVGASFVPGTVGAAQSPPAPGTCTWEDRGFRPGEPTRFYLSTRNQRDAGHLAGRTRDGDFQWYVFVFNEGTSLQVTAVN